MTPASAARPARPEWLPWGTAAAAGGCTVGFLALLVAIAVSRYVPAALGAVFVLSTLTTCGFAAMLLLGAAYVKGSVKKTVPTLPVPPPAPPKPAPTPPKPAPTPPKPGPMPPKVMARLVAPLAVELAGTMTGGNSRLVVWNEWEREVAGVPVFKFRWSVRGSEPDKGDAPEQPAVFRAVRVPLANRVPVQRSRPVLVIPGQVRPNRPVDQDCVAGAFGSPVARLLNVPAVRAALVPLSGGWVAIHHTAVVVHVQDVGRGTMPVERRIDATMALARALDAVAAESAYWPA